MKIYLNHITGLDDAVTALYMSRRTWTRELEEKIRRFVPAYVGADGMPAYEYEDQQEFVKTGIELVKKIGQKHITLLRFIDLSVTVEGLHRGGQDDWDSHAKRFDNRIIRNSTRLADFKTGEISEWYQDKIIPMDIALAMMGVFMPEEIVHNGTCYVRTVNGYVRHDMLGSKDAKRGLYMLSIPSNFVFKVNLCEWAHVWKERNNDGTANPEVKQCAEAIQDQVERLLPWFDREWLRGVNN